MTAALDRCTALLGDPNVAAFLHVIGAGESDEQLSEGSFRIINGGAHFDAPPWRHPFHGIPTTKGGRAAGFGQFLGTTWAEIDRALGLNGDFSPPAQRAGAVYLIERRGALAAVMAGDLVLACSKLAQEWVSLPGLGLARVLRVFLAYGGRQSGAGAAQEPPEASGQPEAPRAPLEPISGRPAAPLEAPNMLAMLLPAIFQAFAPRAQAALGRITEQSPEVLQPFVEDLFGKLGQATGVGQIKTDAQAIEAVAALQKLKAENSALVAEIENHALDYLDKLAPLFDRLSAADKATNEAMLAGRNAAMLRQQAADPELVQVVVRNVNGQSWMVLGGLVVAMMVAIACKAKWPDTPDYFTVILALAGPLFGQVMKERGAIIGYFFDGTPAANASNAINAQIVASSQK